MTKAITPKKVQELTVSIVLDGDMDKISIDGWRFNEDYYPDGDVKYIAFSDGTLIMYRHEKKNKLFVLKRGYAYKNTEKDKKERPTVVVLDPLKISWIVYGDRY